MIEITINHLTNEEENNNYNLPETGVCCLCGGEYTEYSDDLYYILGSSKYCSLSTNNYNKRLTASVHTGHTKADAMLVNLASFAYIFYDSFDKDAGIEQFLSDYPALDEKVGEMQVAHVNSIKEINLKSNLMLMSEEINNALGDIMREFITSYKVYTAVNDKKEILIEYRRIVVNTSDKPQKYTEMPTYHKCTSAEDFLYWVVFVSLRFEEMKNKKEIFIWANDQLYGTHTQAGIRSNNKGKGKKKFMLTIKEYREHEEKLLSMDNSEFTEDKIQMRVEKVKGQRKYYCSEEEISKHFDLLKPAIIR